MMDNKRKEELLEELGKIMPDAQFRYGTIVKCNDCKKEALHMVSTGDMAAPIFYLDDYAHLTPKEMAYQAKEMIEKFSVDQSELKELLFSPDFVRENVRIQLVNTKRNREYLKDKPHFQAGAELSAVLYLALGEHGEAKAVLSDTAITGLGLDEKELKAEALKNMWENRDIQSMSDTILSIMVDDGVSASKSATDKIMLDLETGNMRDMIVISNRERVSGAATILCPEFQERCKQDLVILPSSTHEVIAVPYDANTDLRELQKMVEEINRTSVHPKDFLSDNVYVFDHKTKTISLACDKYGLTPICDDTKLKMSENKVVIR